MNPHISNEKLFSLKHNNLSAKYMNEHNKFLKSVINSPKKYYENVLQRFVNEGKNMSCPEFEHIILYLEENIKIKLDFLKRTNNLVYNILKPMAYMNFIEIMNIMYKQKNVFLPYAETVRVIYSCLKFFDLYARLNSNLGTYYHTTNYLYYLLKLLEADEFAFVLPTISLNITAIDFIKLRPVPVYLAGVSIECIYVDEYNQSPIEFFLHDINHARRMHENYIKYKNFIDDSFKFQEKIMSLIDINLGDPLIVKAMKQLMTIIIFEIIHEDALYLLPDIIWDACHRDDEYVYVFEKTIKSGNKLDVIDHPIKVEGALAYVKTKLQYQFYDHGDDENIVMANYRYAKFIAMAVMIMLKKLYNKKILDYVYYLNRTCKNDNIPVPVNEFKIGNSGNKYDATSFKTGLAQNYWKNGHRRVIGEHIDDSINTKNDSKCYKYNFDLVAHQRDEEELKSIEQHFVITSKL